MRMAKAWPPMKATEKTEETHFHLSVSKGYHTNSSRCCCKASVQISRSTEKSEEMSKLSCLCSTLADTCPLAVLHAERMKLPQQFCIRSSAEKPPSLSQESVWSKPHKRLQSAIHALANTKGLGRLCPDSFTTQVGQRGGTELHHAARSTEMLNRTALMHSGLPLHLQKWLPWLCLFFCLLVFTCCPLLHPL